MQEISEPDMAARIEKQQGGQSVPVKDVAHPDEVEVKDTEEHQPHVAAEKDVGDVLAATALSALGKQDNAGAEEHGERGAHLALEEHPANGPRDKVVGAVMADDEGVGVHLQRAAEGCDIHEQDAHEGNSAHDIDGRYAFPLSDGLGKRSGFTFDGSGDRRRAEVALRFSQGDGGSFNREDWGSNGVGHGEPPGKW